MNSVKRMLAESDTMYPREAVRMAAERSRNDELLALKRELQACLDATPDTGENTYTRGVRDGFSIALRNVVTRLHRS